MEIFDLAVYFFDFTFEVFFLSVESTFGVVHLSLQRLDVVLQLFDEVDINGAVFAFHGINKLSDCGLQLLDSLCIGLACHGGVQFVAQSVDSGLDGCGHLFARYADDTVDLVDLALQAIDVIIIVRAADEHGSCRGSQCAEYCNSNEIFFHN